MVLPGTVVPVVLGGIDEPPLLSVLMTLTSYCGVSVSVSVELLLLGLGSVTPAGGVTEAVLARVPVSEGLMARVMVKLEVPVGATVPVVKLTVLLAEL